MYSLLLKWDPVPADDSCVVEEGLLFLSVDPESLAALFSFLASFLAALIASENRVRLLQVSTLASFVHEQ